MVGPEASRRWPVEGGVDRIAQTKPPSTAPPRLPKRVKPRGASPKRLAAHPHAAPAAPLIPKGILRARKRGFSIPAAAWLRGELEPFARELLSPERTRAQGYFDPGFVEQLPDEHVSRRQDHSRQLWGLMSFSLWAEQMEHPLPPSATEGVESAFAG